MIVSVNKVTLPFKIPATTSRGAYKDREVYLVTIEKDGISAIGECSPLIGLSIDYNENLEEELEGFSKEINETQILDPYKYQKHPAFIFALESALRQIETKKQHLLYSTDFILKGSGIPINGLIWMADSENMREQMEKKLKEGYSIIKLKIGAIDFDEECRLIESLRKHKNAFQLEIRVDANGVFENDHVLEKLKELSRFELHSIEQPIKQGQWDAMQEVCAKSPIPVALDEELIGVLEEKEKLIKHINPQFLILKPTLLGGFKYCDEWISLANKYDKGWWATSALESNIGLNAIAQWVSTHDTEMAQGLGTGQLFVKNYDLGLSLKNGYLYKNANFTGDLI
jgi:o-succinylbenzoate synthase